jgi:hypothetical protein
LASADCCAIHTAKPVMRNEDRDTWERRLRAEERQRRRDAAKAAADAVAAENRKKYGRGR